MARKRTSSDASDADPSYEPGPSTPKASPSKKPKPSPKSTPKNPGIKAKRKSWKETLVPWEADPTYQHPAKADTITKVNAGKLYKLSPEDLGTLPHVEEPNPHGPVGSAPKCIYLARDVKDLSERKANHVGLKKPSPSPGEKFMASQPLWLREHLKASKDPTVRMVHEYVQPEGVKRADPENIYWLGGAEGPFKLRDACLLYCLEPEKLADLAEGSKWLDQKSVAMRALTLHGGFYAYTDMIRNKVQSEIVTLQNEDVTESPNLMRFSPAMRQQLGLSGGHPPHDAGDHIWTKPLENWPSFRVIQYRPPKRYDIETSDWSADELWYPTMEM